MDARSSWIEMDMRHFINKNKIQAEAELKCSA